LLACPVQNATLDAIHDPFFEKIYALYSTRDTIQVLDPQGMYRLDDNPRRHLAFSHHRFPADAHLHQAKITGRWLGFMHQDFVDPSFIQHLPTALHALDTWEEEVPVLPNQERELILLHCGAPVGSAASGSDS
jgi:hypothetical protein